jgi:peptide/nickel transport system ATP-binding protein/oligopeptide transport system ATP-binding protein
MIFVTHDLAQVAALADRVVVMYGGRIIETGTVADVFRRPRHPYTEGLLGSIPRPGLTRLRPIEGDVPKITDVPDDRCSLIPRCPYAESLCETGIPPMMVAGDGAAACFMTETLQLHGIDGVE